jgi:hypothetical protein
VVKRAEVLYTRQLPGGGYVTIEAAPSEAPADATANATETPVHGVLRVERRADPARRSGHRPPVVVEATGPTDDRVLDALRPIATDNVEVARAIRRWQLSRVKPGDVG